MDDEELIFMQSELTLELVKKHLNIDESFTDDDKYLHQLIEASLNIVIKRLGLTYEDFPFSDEQVCRYKLNNGCVLGLNNPDGKCPLLCANRSFCRKITFEPALLQGILIMIGNLYNNRESVSDIKVNKIPYTLDYMLECYKNYK